MFPTAFRRATLIAALALSVSPCLPAAAAPSTAQGRISVAQVQQMLDRAPTDTAARQVLTAYLAGVGETAGVVVDMGGGLCRQPLSLSVPGVREAIGAAAKGADMAQVPATPLIVREMMQRAGCRKV